MSLIQLKKKEDCMFDMISLGEVMLRLDPGEGRIRTARSFRAWEGGDEAALGHPCLPCSRHPARHTAGVHAAVST